MWVEICFPELCGIEILSFPVKFLKQPLDSVNEVRMREAAGASLQECKLPTGFPMRIFIIIFSILLKGNLAG